MAFLPDADWLVATVRDNPVSAAILRVPCSGQDAGVDASQSEEN